MCFNKTLITFWKWSGSKSTVKPLKPDRLMKKLMIAAVAVLLMSSVAFAQDDMKKDQKKMKHDAKAMKHDAKKSGNDMMADSAKSMKKNAKMMKKQSS
ncbi:hypothetical protein GCM10028808_36990 [Spirosoma migulaei]